MKKTAFSVLWYYVRSLFSPCPLFASPAEVFKCCRAAQVQFRTSEGLEPGAPFPAWWPRNNSWSATIGPSAAQETPQHHCPWQGHGDDVPGSLALPLGAGSLLREGPGSETAEITNPGRKGIQSPGSNREVASEVQGRTTNANGHQAEVISDVHFGWEFSFSEDDYLIW